MSPALFVLIALLVATVLGVSLQRRATLSPKRALAVVRLLRPDAHATATNALTFTIAGRTLIAETTDTQLILSTALPEIPLPWRAAARAIGDGPILALLAEPVFTTENNRLSISLPLSLINPRTCRRGLARLTSLAEQLEAISIPQALARHLLDHAAPEARMALFTRLIADYPEAPVTRQCALSCACESDQPALQRTARLWLDRSSPSTTHEPL